MRQQVAGELGGALYRQLRAPDHAPNPPGASAGRLALALILVGSPMP